MEGRKRWVIASIGFNPESEYLPEIKEANVNGMMWTGKYFYPMWTFELKGAKVFDVKDEAESAALFFAVKHHEWMGKLEVRGFMDYGPKVGEAGEA